MINAEDIRVDAGTIIFLWSPGGFADVSYCSAAVTCHQTVWSVT